ncbi:insulinase family protein [Enterovibrio sp. ZSDZ42]|uniref:Insulinase family protein n=1 Tax=Enterovibrio gelatinilyticus TaxID=2899819 RepID=A0ABT5R608_9GAMM|nr:M16 family metallopeptidase [Enterovibrio sp. ZSDZ42]MDD1795710.1 insulinase family protein [Enterovibrio sp. ZSDZ42]
MKQLLTLLLAISVTGCNSTLIPDPIQADTSWQHTTLDNGLNLHIQKQQGASVSVRLLVHTGSIDEEADQSGYAHFLEHMAFNGSENFQKNDVIKLFGDAGLNFGQHLNAYTYYDWTYYKLDLPNNSHLPQALNWFKDISTGLMLSPDAVDAEKGVVLGELRRQEASQNSIYFKAHMALADEAYEGNINVLGTRESITNLSLQRLRDYYQTNYTPDRAELIISGDIDKTDVDTLIRSTFGDWPRQERPTERQTKATQFNAQPITLTVADNEFPSFSLIFKPENNALTEGVHFEKYANHLILANAISTRLNDRASDTQAPIQSISSSVDYLFDSPQLIVGMDFESNNREAAMTFLAKELATLRDHGLSSLEIEAQLTVFADDEKNLKTNWTATEFADEKLTDLLNGTQTLSQAQRTALSSRYATLADNEYLNKQLRQLLSDDGIKPITGLAHNQIIDKNTDKLVTASLAAFDNTFNKKGQKLILPEAIDDFPQPKTTGEIASVIAVTPDTTKFKLSNNVNVYLRHMPDTGDRIYIYAGAQGGISSLSTQLRPAAYMAPGAYALTGLGGMSSTDFNRFMVKNSSYLEPMIDENRQGFYGETTRSSLPALLAVINQAYQYAAVDESKFEQHKSNFVTNEKQFHDSLNGKSFSAFNAGIYTPSSPRYGFKPEDYDAVNVKQVRDAYQQLFNVNRGLTFVIAGNISEEELKPFLRTYIAGMTFEEETSNWQYSLNINSEKTNIVYAYGPRGNNVEFVTGLVHSGEEKTTRDRFLADIAGRIMTQRLLENIREDASLDYSPYSFVMWPDGADKQIFMFVSNVSLLKREQAKERIANVVDSLGDGITDQEYSSNLTQLGQALKEGLNLPKEQARMMFNYVLYDADPLAVINPNSVLETITKEELETYMAGFVSKNAIRYEITNLPSAN